MVTFSQILYNTLLFTKKLQYISCTGCTSLHNHQRIWTILQWLNWGWFKHDDWIQGEQIDRTLVYKGIGENLNSTCKAVSELNGNHSLIYGRC